MSRESRDTAPSPREGDALLLASLGTGCVFAAIGTAILLFNGIAWIVLAYWTGGRSAAAIPFGLWLFPTYVAWLLLSRRRVPLGIKVSAALICAVLVAALLVALAFPGLRFLKE